MNTLDAILTRRSCREFTDKPIKSETLHQLLEAAMSGPSCVNARDWSFVVVTDPEKLAQMADANGRPAEPLRKAAAGILVCGDLDRAFRFAKDYWIIDGAIAAQNGAAFLCYVTPAEHLALPNLEDVKQGIMASKIAAHAADIAKGVRGAREIDDKMADARRVLDWEAQWACAMDPETAKKVRDDRKPEHEDTCSMCGKFCAVRSMNKALAGEHIDIL